MADRSESLHVRLDLTIIIGAFVLASGLAGLIGADNLGIALAFGQIAFAIATVTVMIRRP